LHHARANNVTGMEEADAEIAVDRNPFMTSVPDKLTKASFGVSYRKKGLCW
jgi:hypothetical protein